MPSVYSDPTTEVSAVWSVRAATAIDDAVRQPTVPTAGTGEIVYEEGKSSVDSRQEWNCGDISAISGATADKWRVWFYVSSLFDENVNDVDLRISGTWKGSYTSSDSWATTGWHYAEFSGGESIASGLTGMGLALQVPSLLSSGLQSDNISGAYIELFYTVSSGGSGGAVIKSVIQDWETKRGTQGLS